MSDEIYKQIFAKNLNKYLSLNDKTQVDLVNDLGFNKSAVSTWCNASRLPRMDKVDILAKYFGVKRSDLIEEKEDAEQEIYYLNPETREIAQEIFENPDMRSLFDMSRKMEPDRLKAHLELMKQLLGKEER